MQRSALDALCICSGRDFSLAEQEWLHSGAPARLLVTITLRILRLAAIMKGAAGNGDELEAALWLDSRAPGLWPRLSREGKLYRRSAARRDLHVGAGIRVALARADDVRAACRHLELRHLARGRVRADVARAAIGIDIDAHQELSRQGIERELRGSGAAVVHVCLNLGRPVSRALGADGVLADLVRPLLPRARWRARV